MVQRFMCLLVLGCVMKIEAFLICGSYSRKKSKLNAIIFLLLIEGEDAPLPNSWTIYVIQWFTTRIVNACAGCTLSFRDGSQHVYDGCIIALHAPDAIRILGKEATYDEVRILGAFQYVNRFVFFSFSFLEYILVVLTISWLSLRSYWQDSFKLGISCYGFLKLHLNILYCNINFLFSLTHFHHSLVCCTREGRYVIKTSMNIHYILINM